MFLLVEFKCFFQYKDFLAEDCNLQVKHGDYAVKNLNITWKE